MQAQPIACFSDIQQSLNDRDENIVLVVHTTSQATAKRRQRKIVFITDHDTVTEVDPNLVKKPVWTC